jgi:hypothetical protein
MHPEIYKNSPFRKPRWRADRVMQMVETQPLPLKSRSYDDSYVRTYRRFLLLLINAGDDEAARFAVMHELPHVFHAHELCFDSDRHLRDMLEARLLTDQPFSEISHRLGTDPLTIEFFEALFFNVRDRLKHKDWIAKVISAQSGDLSPNMKGATAEDQRAYLYRLIGFHGGALALDALFGGTPSTATPTRADDVVDWFDDSLGQTLRSRVVEIASILDINQHNTPRLIKMARDLIRAKEAARARAKLANPMLDQQDQQIEDILAAVERALSPPWWPTADGTDQPNSTPPA